jgi:hypothetical protein
MTTLEKVQFNFFGGQEEHQRIAKTSKLEHGSLPVNYLRFQISEIMLLEVMFASEVEGKTHLAITYTCLRASPRDSL